MRGRGARVLAALAVLLGTVVAGSTSAHAAASTTPVITSLSSHSGPTTGGTLVTVRGREIGPHLLVSFLGRSIGYHRVSASEIVVRVPARSIPGSGWVRVHTSAGGTSAHSAASAYTYRWPAPQITSLSSHLGSIYGGNIVVHGRYLWDVRSVSFDGVASPQVSGQDTTLYVQVPSHATATTTVTVTTATGSSRAAGATSSYEFFPPPTVSSLTPAAGPVIGGTTVQIHGSGLRASMSVRFGSTPATDVHVANASFATVTAPGHAAAGVPVTVTTPVGTTSSTTYRYGAVVPEQWGERQVIDPGQWVRQLACVGPDFCMATDNTDHYVTRGPSGWSAPSTDTPAGSTSLSCTSPTFCMATIHDVVSTWNGTAWTTSDVAVPFGVMSLSCTSATFCAAAGDGKAATWDGAHWSSPAPPGGNTATRVSCWADGRCVTSDSYGYLSELQGGTWSADGHLAVFGHGTVTTLRCTAPGACMAGTTAGAVVTPAGAVDQVLTDPIVHIECGSAMSCLAEDEVSVTTWDGTSWSAPVQAPNEITAVSCPAERTCDVVTIHSVQTVTW